MVMLPAAGFEVGTPSPCTPNDNPTSGWEFGIGTMIALPTGMGPGVRKKACNPANSMPNTRRINCAQL